jgi:hypothetical protein
MNLVEQKQLLADLESAAYDCAGALVGLLALHRKGALELPPGVAQAIAGRVDRLASLQASYHAESALMKAAADKREPHA